MKDAKSNDDGLVHFIFPRHATPKEIFDGIREVARRHGIPIGTPRKARGKGRKKNTE